MFTGIVQEQGRVVSIEHKAEILTVRVGFPQGYLTGIAIGASVALHGCCLTVTAIYGDEATFDLVPETITRTCFNELKVGDLLNAERSLTFGAEVGGHILSGHVDTVASITDIQRFEHSRVVTFKVSAEAIKYLFDKGFVAINGASLTIVSVAREALTFGVALIPETLAKTTFGNAIVGARVNIEFDRTTHAIVNTVERVLAERR